MEYTRDGQACEGKDGGGRQNHQKERDRVTDSAASARQPLGLPAGPYTVKYLSILMSVPYR